MPNLPYTSSTLGMDQFKELFECYSEFEDDLSNPETHPMAVFWNSYLEMVQTLRDFVKSIKTGDCDLHMYASRRCFTGFIPTTTTIMLATSPTIGHRSKLLHRTIPAYSSISKRVEFQSDVLQESSTKFLQIRLSSNLLTKTKKVEVI